MQRRFHLTSLRLAQTWRPALTPLAVSPHAAPRKRCALRSLVCRQPPRRSGRTPRTKEKAPHYKVKCNSTVWRNVDQISSDRDRSGNGRWEKRQVKETFLKPPRYAIRLSPYVLLTLYHYVPRLSIGADKIIRAPSVALASCPLSWRSSIPITRGLRPYKTNILSGTPDKTGPFV